MDTNLATRVAVSDASGLVKIGPVPGRIYLALSTADGSAFRVALGTQAGANIGLYRAAQDPLFTLCHGDVGDALHGDFAVYCVGGAGVSVVIVEGIKQR